ncbi:MAG TPA: DNA-binding domain-containing protein [Actinomycetota bacterium]|nr:DNA-binding domain-containing protein [Actinomycetota bacterium]
MPEPPGLRPLQAWVQAVLRHPDGPAAGAASPEAVSALGREARVGELVAPSSRLGPEERLGLYHRGYHLRLLECLRAMHPGLRHALGPDLFDGFSLDYLHAHPSTNRSLFQLNAGFAAHLETHRPDRDGPDEVWPDFLIELARLERAFLEVYDGPGVEEDWIPSAQDLPAEHWTDADVVLAPCTRLLGSRFPVGDYLVAVRSGQDPPLPLLDPLPEPTFLALTRRAYQVSILTLDPAGYQLLEALGAGVTLSRAAAGWEMASAWEQLRHWADCGLLASVSPVRSTTPASRRTSDIPAAR